MWKTVVCEGAEFTLMVFMVQNKFTDRRTAIVYFTRNFIWLPMRRPQRYPQLPLPSSYSFCSHGGTWTADL